MKELERTDLVSFGRGGWQWIPKVKAVVEGDWCELVPRTVPGE